MELDKQNIDTGQNEAMQSLPLKRKLAFAMGDIGNNFSWTFVSSYLKIGRASCRERVLIQV